MADKIEVGYTPAAFVGDLGIHHKYILYTKDVGLPTEQQFYARGGPGFFGPGADDGGRDETSSSPFGNIKTKVGEYNKDSADWDKARAPIDPDPIALPHPRETIAEGDDLSQQWGKIKETIKEVGDRKIPYDPRSTNSNSTVDEALREAGLPAPKLDGPNEYWSPGSDFDLPGGDAPGSADEQKFFDDFDRWIQEKISDNFDELSEDFGWLWDWLKEPSPNDQLEDQKLIDAFLREILPLTMSRNDIWEPLESIKRKTQSASLIPSPIVLDLDDDGVETISVANGTWFDHAADGFAERTGWAASNDGLLVRDLDGNSSIDSGRELFGSETLLPNGTNAANGFEALKALDANTDGVINAQDAAFAELRVWKDANANGRTDAGELLTLADAGVGSINVNYTNSSHIDAQGNAHRQVGSYTTTSGETRTATDIWVQTNPTQSLPVDWVDVPEDIASLPDAQGYPRVCVRRTSASLLQHRTVLTPLKMVTAATCGW